MHSSGLQGGTVYVVNSQNDGEGAPRIMGLLSRLQMQPSAALSQDAAAQAFSSMFSGRASGFLDSSLSAWVDQQVAALDQLQEQMLPPPQPRIGCPRMAAMRAAAAAGGAVMPADALSYMASARFGQGLISFTQQDDDEPAAYDSMGDWELTGADVGEEADSDDDADDDDVAFDAGGMGEYLAQALQDDANAPLMVLDVAQDGGVMAAQGRGFMPSMLAEEDSLPGPSDFWTAAAQQAQMQDDDEQEEEDDDDDGPTWFFVFEDGSINWGFIVFLALAAGVVPIWCLLIRTLVHLLSGRSCGTGGCPFTRRFARQQAREQFVTVTSKTPLLADYLVPLAPEKPVAEKAAPQLFASNVEVASEQKPHGEYFEAKKNEFVTILV